MSKLKNERHEQYAQLMAVGDISWQTAFEQIGYKISCAFNSQLKANPKIQKRIAEIQSEAITDKVMSLSERLELLTSWIRDVNMPKSFRLQCMKELSEQDGSKVRNLNVNSTTSNTIRYVDIELPKKQGQDKEGQDKEGQDRAYTGAELEGLEQFLKEVDGDALNDSDLDDLFKEI